MGFAGMDDKHSPAGQEAGSAVVPHLILAFQNVEQLNIIMIMGPAHALHMVMGLDQTFQGKRNVVDTADPFIGGWLHRKLQSKNIDISGQGYYSTNDWGVLQFLHKLKTTRRVFSYDAAQALAWRPIGITEYQAFYPAQQAGISRKKGDTQ